MSISLTFVEYHKARPREGSSYWSIIYSWCILSYISQLKYSHLSFVLFSKRATIVSDRELFFNKQRKSNFLNETMGKTAYDVYKYSDVVVIVFGILGNILVIISILRQKKMLKNNYYLLVIHLAMCNV
jgi:hypothetical protein